MSKASDANSRPDVRDVIGARPMWGRTWRRTLKWSAAAVLCLAALAGYWFWDGETSAVRYATEPVTRGNLNVVVTATGSVQPTNKVDVSSELSGTVRRVFVDFNSIVAANQPLAELDADRLTATVNSSRARLASARAKVTDAQATTVEKDHDLARKKRLAQSQAVSVADVDQAQAAHDRSEAALLVALAEVGVAEAELQLNESNLVKTKIVSPIAGVVLKRNVDPGQTVASSLQAPVLFSIAEDLRKMELQVDVDEADVGKVTVGQSASFDVDAFPDRKFPATIRDVRFASETIQGVVTYKAVLNIDNSELLLRPGMTATAEIKVTEVRDALLVPNAALRYSPAATTTTPNRGFLRSLLPGRPSFRPASQHDETGRSRTVWTLAGGAPTRTNIVIGLSDGKRTQVETGDLDAGELVIVDQTLARR